MTLPSGARPASFRTVPVDAPVAVLLVAPDEDAVALDGRSGFTVTRVDSAAAIEQVLPASDQCVDCVVHTTETEAAPETLATVRSHTDAPYLLYGADPAPEVLETVLSATATEYLPRFESGCSDLLATRIRRAVTQAQLEHDLQLKDRALEQAGVGITIAGPDESLLYVNDGFEEMTGYSAETVIGQNCRFLQGEDTDPETVASIRDAIDANEPISVVLKNYDADGEPFWNQLDIAPVFDEDGEVTHYFGFQKNVTEREELGHELRRQNERLEEFASVVSHDIRGPLSVAKGHVETVAEQTSSDGLEAALAALDRIERIVGDVLTLAREGDVVADPEPVGLEAVVTRAWQTGETGDLAIAVEGTLGMIEADPDRLQTLFENLFRNVADHATGATTVTVGRLESPVEAGFYVADDGPGIPEDERESVFEHGFTTDTDGTGFGLAIVERIATAHGWSVTVEESGTGGARFVVS
ncbi:PAS domain-containing protein [Haloarchaeobius sp. DYHT-AS-18]|uniref:PAS domain-containing protein n=1 Tax=Haloarchaeobius sp. DYHT-AS-18 TaxID=3446117 RepID=UPI003EBA5720